MATIIKSMVKGYNFLFYDIGNPETRDWLLMSSPFPTLAIMGIYLWFVNDYGRKMMEYRKPFKLDRIIQVYNAIQIFLSSYTCYKLLKHGWYSRYSWQCAPVIFELEDPDDYAMASMMHLYFITKIVDLLDTVFFTLRKKYNQISFLHLYHHTGMVALGWGAVNWFTTGHGTMLMTVNSAVHTILYSYYLLTSISPQYGNTWWKKYITKIQLLQFLFLSIHFGKLVFNNPCNFAPFGLMIIIPQNMFMFILFSDFYYKAYMRPKPVKASNVMQRLWEWQHYHFVEKVDPRISSYPLFGPSLGLGPPWGLFGIVAAYIYFVKFLGPRLMENRKPVELRRIMIAYNAMQVLFSGYTFYESFVAGWGGRYSWFCQYLGPDDYTPMDIRAARCSWLYFFSKIVDLADTVFIVLRKNYKQLSFLHVYHHAVMVLGVWYGIAYSPGGHVTFVGFLNTFVHTIMYSYYLATLLFGTKSFNFLKKWITRMQLLQFLGVFVHSAQVLFQPSCRVDRSNMVFLMIQSVIMTALFSNYYYHAYVKKKHQA
ncbi:uncharacterized protein LOC117646255 [Thrips palmi]|uniref:Elongation of very long chain fatty acids protein n=1 Tax=Thrips palmi TaxID=161013 RepID=A0A6P8Z7W4_THRPL|nr:uncharacterized protein LOC117646255 [Thrips palmi]